MMRIPNPLNTKDEPSFISDVAPFFLPTLLSMFGLLLYQMTGNAALAPWMIFVGTPLYNRLILDDQTNLPKASERKFETSYMFHIPLFVVVFWCVMAWIHGLMLFSGDYKGIMFQNKPEGGWEMFCYFGGLSFFAALA